MNRKILRTIETAVIFGGNKAFKKGNNIIKGQCSI